MFRSLKSRLMNQLIFFNDLFDGINDLFDGINDLFDSIRLVSSAN